MLKTVLSEIRPMGRPSSSKRAFASTGSIRLRDIADKASDFFPRDWINRLDVQIKFKESRRGYFREGRGSQAHEIAISGGRGELAGDPNGFTTMVHELGHMMERQVPGVRVAESIFYRRRAMPDGEPLRKYRYGDSHEVVRPDEFADEYIGKDYSYRFSDPPIGVPNLTPPGMDVSYEILSMGLEGVWNGQYRMWERDPDMRNFILGMLASL
jgi:hypothetical protein